MLHWYGQPSQLISQKCLNQPCNSGPQGRRVWSSFHSLASTSSIRITCILAINANYQTHRRNSESQTSGMGHYDVYFNKTPLPHVEELYRYNNVMENTWQGEECRGWKGKSPSLWNCIIKDQNFKKTPSTQVIDLCLQKFHGCLTHSLYA